MIVRKILRVVVNTVVNFFLSLLSSRRFVDRLITARMLKLITVTHKSQMMKFVDANHLCRYRAESFSTKEPDTLEWIETIPEGSVLWDVGANVGLYSIYAALQSKCKVFAFEPSVFNLEILAKNIYVNQLQDLITIVPIALTDKLGVSLFRMTSTDWGGALSTFDKTFGQKGEKLKAIFEYRTMGITMNDAICRFGIPRPNFIKLDVDGIEHLILKDSYDAVKYVDSILVEIDYDFEEQAEQSAHFLVAAGFTLYRKRHMVGRQFNQWWHRYH